jgi:hypothetical protein
VTEDPTLLPPLQQDKRTKEVFALSLERMNARSGRGFAPAMDRLDVEVSAQRMTPAVHRFVTRAVTVHVWNRYFSYKLETVFLARFHGICRIAPAKGRRAARALADRFQMNRKFRFYHPVFTDVDL